MFKDKMFKVIIMLLFIIFAREIYADDNTNTNTNNILSASDFDKQAQQTDQQNEAKFQDKLKTDLSNIPPPPGPAMEIPGSSPLTTLPQGEQGNATVSRRLQSTPSSPTPIYNGYTPASPPASSSPQSGSGWKLY